MDVPQNSARLPYRGNNAPVMEIERLTHLTDKKAGMASPRTGMATLRTQSCPEPSSHHQVSGQRTSHVSDSSLTNFSAGDPRGEARSWRALGLTRDERPSLIEPKVKDELVRRKLLSHCRTGLETFEWQDWEA